MELLRIYSYTDENYSHEHMGKLTLPINPEAIKSNKGITYQEDKQLGSTNGTNSFEAYKPEKLSFNLIIDCTGVVEGTQRTDKVYDKVEDLENHLYTYNSEGHRPSYVVLAYGEIIFKGQLTVMNVEYQLFNNNGIPLRAKIDLEFSGFRADKEDKKKYSKLSPDMSRLVTIKEGDTLAALCDRIYGNSLLAAEVARFNNLNGFRNLPAGTDVLFPPLKKN